MAQDNKSLLTGTLKSVSRSFYLSLRVLPEKMRAPLGLGYLLCRAADTIADTDAIPSDQRLNLLKQLTTLMGRFPLEMAHGEEFCEQLQNSLAASETTEAELLKRFKDSLFLLKSLPRTDQSLIQEIVCGVIQGMMMDLHRFGPSSETLKAFSTKQELESYLGWIGGEPGRFWTKMSLKHAPRLQVKDPARWSEDGFRFGTGLQMVNILRDIPSDLKRGRCYIPLDLLREQNLRPEDLSEKESHARFLPLYHRLIDDAINRMKGGMDYLHQIPVSYFRLRAAVWWPLALGMKTLALLRNNYFALDPNRPQKISRWTVWGVLLSSPALLLADNFLGQYFAMTKDQASSDQ